MCVCVCVGESTTICTLGNEENINVSERKQREGSESELCRVRVNFTLWSPLCVCS